MRDLGHAIKSKLLSGISLKASVNKKHGVCECCAKAKCTRHSFARAQPAAQEEKKALVPQKSVMRRVDTDLKGPISVPGPKGELYFQLFTEADSKWRTPKFLTAKSEASSTLREYITVDLANEGQTVLEYQSDGAPELISKENVRFLAGQHCRLT